MATTFKMKQGDLEPDLEMTLCKSDGVTPVDLSAALSVKIRFVRRRHEIFERAMTVVSQATEANWGKVSYAWQAGDTDIPGDYQATFVVEWAGGTRPQTFPASRYQPVRIERVAT